MTKITVQFSDKLVVINIGNCHVSWILMVGRIKRCNSLWAWIEIIPCFWQFWREQEEGSIRSMQNIDNFEKAVTIVCKVWVSRKTKSGLHLLVCLHKAADISSTKVAYVKGIIYKLRDFSFETNMQPMHVSFDLWWMKNVMHWLHSWKEYFGSLGDVIPV